MVKITISAETQDELKQSVQQVARCFQVKGKPRGMDKQPDRTKNRPFYKAYINAEPLNRSTVQ